MPNVAKMIILILASAGLVWMSWKSLQDPYSHGFYRFSAFEALLVLIVLNSDFWFRDPFGNLQLISWFLLSASCVLAAHGFLFLYRQGKPDNQIMDPSRLSIEKTTLLVTSGAYRYIRHPIYSSALLGTIGVFLKRPTLTGVCVAILAILFLVITAKQEERENIRIFGDHYREYMKRTKMFLPRML